MKKPNKRETVNLFFSAFLILAFIVCAQFFSQFAANLTGVDGKLSVAGQLVTSLIYVVFGLLVFYATRVGDGKAIKRFSPLTLVILVLPSLYIIIASIAKFMPLNSVLASNNGTISVIAALASVALGYGIPYTFLSGFELQAEDEPETESETVLEGGIEADVIEAQEETAEVVQETEEAAQEAAEEAEAPVVDAEAEDKTEETAE